MADDPIQRYLEAVLKLSSERGDQHDEAARRAIARELGISDEELAAARRVGEDHLVRGLGFLSHDLLDDATKSLLEAEALLPDDPRVLEALGANYLAKRDKPRVRNTAMRMLALDPKSRAAFDLLRALERRADMRRAVGVFVAVALVLGGGTLVWMQRAPSTLAQRPDEPPKEPERPPPSAQACAKMSMCAMLVPEVPALAGSELSFEPTVTGLYHDYDGYKLKLVGRVRQSDGSELERLEVEAVSFDAGGHELDRFPVTLYPTFMPPLRPGETYPFHVAERVKPASARVKLEVSVQQSAAAPPSYDRSAPLSTTVAAGLPSHLKVSIAERSAKGRVYAEKSSAEGVLEVTNSGQAVIRSLEVTVQCNDARGGLVDDAHETIVYSHMPAMQPGEKRVRKYSCYGNGKIAQKRVLVTALE